MIVDMDAVWLGSKSENVEKALVFKKFFAQSRGARARQPNERTMIFVVVSGSLS